MKLVFNAICIALLLSFSACEKEGAQGPQGAQGEQGNPGAQGSQGIRGENGSAILSGTTDPSGAIGKDGDFYLNLNSKKLFGPKKSGNWGTAIDLNGKDGQNGQNGQNGSNGINGSNGADGNTILSGNSLPNYYSGKLGDFYIDLSKMDFYGPKTNNGWGSPVSLKSILPYKKEY